MTLKSHVSRLADQLEQRAEELPERVEDAKTAVEEWGRRARVFVQKNPGVTIVGALAAGFILAKAARHA